MKGKRCTRSRAAAKARYTFVTNDLPLAFFTLPIVAAWKKNPQPYYLSMTLAFTRDDLIATREVRLATPLKSEAEFREKVGTTELVPPGLAESIGKEYYSGWEYVGVETLHLTGV